MTESMSPQSEEEDKAERQDREALSGKNIRDIMEQVKRRLGQYVTFKNAFRAATLIGLVLVASHTPREKFADKLLANDTIGVTSPDKASNSTGSGSEIAINTPTATGTSVEIKKIGSPIFGEKAANGVKEKLMPFTNLSIQQVKDFIDNNSSGSWQIVMAKVVDRKGLALVISGLKGEPASDQAFETLMANTNEGLKRLDIVRDEETTNQDIKSQFDKLTDSSSQPTQAEIDWLLGSHLKGDADPNTLYHFPN